MNRQSIFFHQEQQWGQATITLVKDTNGRLGKDTCMQTIPTGDGRFEILIKPQAANYFPEVLIDYIKHEIAHALGLSHPSAEDMKAGCWVRTPTAMGFPEFCGALENNLKLTPNDVTTANAVQNGDKTGCTKMLSRANLSSGGGGGGGGGGTLCTYGEEIDPVFRDRGCYDVYKTPYWDCGSSGIIYGDSYYDGTTCNFEQ